jgi:hypothetical protein
VLESSIAYFFCYAPTTAKLHRSHVNVDGFCIIGPNITFALFNENAVDSIPAKFQRYRKTNGSAANDRDRYVGMFYEPVTQSRTIK